MSNYIQLDRAIAEAQLFPAEKTSQSSRFLNRQVDVISTASLEDLCDERGRIRDLFFSSLSLRDYDRSRIVLQSPLELVLNPEIYYAHVVPDQIDPVTGRKIHETIAETHFSLRLGVLPERAPSEYHTVYYCLDRSLQRLGVFKPRMDKAPLEDHYGASEDREAHLAESASSLLDDYLETRVVPHTELLIATSLRLPELSHTVGSYQFYVSETPFLEAHLQGDNFFDPDHAALRQRLDTQANRELNLQNFGEFAFFDLLTANNDHHFRNVLRKATGELIAIDNGNSFPWCHDRDLPSYKMHPLHWFKWSVLPQAQKPFSEKIIDKIKHFDFERVAAMLRKALVSEDVPSSIEHIEGKIQTLYDRFQVMEKLAYEGVPIAQIAEAILKK
jgi:hypothetical protein